MEGKKEVITLMVYGKTSDVQMRDDKTVLTTEVKSLVLPETRKDTTLLANVLTCLSVLEAEGTEAAHFFVFAGERRHAGTCRCIGMYVAGCSWVSGLTQPPNL
jgi:hypothetical protein